MNDPAADSDHAYFQAIEESFVELRGAPLLLSPADWQVARRWHEEGVPLDLVRRTLAEVFARRKERDAKGKISSLRYCAPAVDAAWEEVRELTAPGRRVEAPAFEVPPRLAALAAAWPAGRPSPPASAPSKVRLRWWRTDSPPSIARCSPSRRRASKRKAWPRSPRRWRRPFPLSADACRPRKWSSPASACTVRSFAGGWACLCSPCSRRKRSRLLRSRSGIQLHSLTASSAARASAPSK